MAGARGIRFVAVWHVLRTRRSAAFVDFSCLYVGVRANTIREDPLTGVLMENNELFHWIGETLGAAIRFVVGLLQ